MSNNFRSFVKDMVGYLYIQILTRAFLLQETDFPSIDKFKKDYVRQMNQRYVNESKKDRQRNQLRQNQSDISFNNQNSSFVDDGKKQEKQSQLPFQQQIHRFFQELIEKNERQKKMIKEREEQKNQITLTQQRELDKRIIIKAQQKLKNYELRHSLKLPSIYNQQTQSSKDDYQNNTFINQTQVETQISPLSNRNNAIFKTAEFQNNKKLNKDVIQLTMRPRNFKRPRMLVNQSVFQMNSADGGLSPSNQRNMKTSPNGAQRYSIYIKRNMANSNQEKSLLDLSVKEVLKLIQNYLLQVIQEIDVSLRTGHPVKFKDFGLQNSAIVQLLDLEKKEIKAKKKDFMKDIDISKRFLERRVVEKNKQDQIFDRLDRSLSIDKTTTIDRSIQKMPVSSNIHLTKLQTQMIREAKEDLMFPTEIDHDQVIIEKDEDYYDSNFISINKEDINHSEEDYQLQPLIKKLIQSTKRKGEFQNIEERILYNYQNGIGIHNIHTKTGKKIPPSVILNKGFA
ncbi:UNKNOWN [Stylonychia lemnae]|uniref:Uncharacterized protein n=1 Tax=Stylonychia lemnae TaxID=5949 RepID=A0A078A893_STYLE|nr:UNKNOWN [Stylonychia lemnae]|eukprot:CDW77797.1 UNKNOWN [Stylonychia lemnae]